MKFKRNRIFLSGLAVLTMSCVAPVGTGTAPPAVSHTVDWDRIAQCESGGNWGHGPVRNSSGTYSGGLMWNHRYWLDFGGGQYAQFPYQATREQQIAVSENMVNGSLIAVDRGWQCYPYRR